MSDYYWLHSALDNDCLQNYSQQFSTRKNKSLKHIARSICAHSFWDDKPDSTFVYRPTPSGAHVAICTNAKREHAKTIQIQLEGLANSTRHLQYLDINRCRKLTKRLAKKIKTTVDPQHLKSAKVIAIPRSGYFIAGMLSYFLPLRHDQLEPSSDSNSPIILVDDCAVSGFRLHQQLSRLENKQVYFFTLLSPAPLREIVRSKEPRVLAFESAREIKVHDSTDKQSSHSDSKRYWLGNCDSFCFPWGESQRFYMQNSTAEKTFLWPVSPIKRSLKTMAQKKLIDVHSIKENKNSAIVTHEHIMYFSDDMQTKLYNSKTGQQFSLDSVATQIWKCLLHNGSIASAIAQLESLFEVDRDQLKNDVNHLIKGLSQLEIITLR